MEISEVENAIKCLDINKTYGMDGVYAEHLKHCDKRIVPLLAMCITGFFVHGFLPSSLLSVISVVLVPVITDKCSKINSSQQCPISLDLRKYHGRDLCIYVLKEVINRHRSLHVFRCF